MNIKLVITIIMSQVIEWYDFTLYGFFAGIFATNYFPSVNHAVSLLATLGVFAISFTARPVGAIVFGSLGDKYGRKKVYFNAFLLMGIATLSIGLIPNYSEIGILAPIILVALRLLQGFSCGGIFTNAIVILGEHASPKFRYFYSSFPWIGALFGTLLGSGVAAFIALYFSHESLYSFAWRFAYIGGGVISFIILVFQNCIIETKDYIQNFSNKNISSSPLRETFSSYKNLIFKIMGANIYLAALSYIGIIYMPIYLSSFLKYSLHQVLWINTFCIFVLITLIPLFAWFCDRFGAKKVFIISSLGFIVCGYPAFSFFLSGNLLLALLGQLIVIIFAAGAMSSSPGMMIDITPARLRLSISSIAYNIIMALCGGTAPLIATYLIHESNNNFAPLYYLFICSLISLTFVLFIHNQSKMIVEP